MTFVTPVRHMRTPLFQFFYARTTLWPSLLPVPSTLFLASRNCRSQSLSLKVYQSSATQENLAVRALSKHQFPTSIMFDLMRLPRELRDNIYRHALVRDQVKITTTAPFWTTELGDLHNPINTRDPTSSAWSHRSTRTRFPLSNKYTDGITVSYCIDPSITELPNLVLLLTCRRVYAEALRVLYEQNTFDFIDTDKADESVCNCLYFISDRPIHIRRLIRHISLKIGPNIDQPFFRW